MASTVFGEKKMKFFEMWKQAAEFLGFSRTMDSELDEFLKTKSCVVDFWVIDRWDNEIMVSEKFPIGTIAPVNCDENTWIITILTELISVGSDGSVIEISFRLNGNPDKNMTVESYELATLMHVINGTFR